MYALLAAAILCEVTGTVALKLSEGMSRLVPTVVVLVCYGVAFFLFSLSLNQGMAVGTAYAIWSGVGVGLVALAGYLFFQETLGWLQLAGFALVVLGVTALQLGGAHS